ncbi:hypothetical protein D3C72_1950680 [compost metagenome]
MAALGEEGGGGEVEVDDRVPGEGTDAAHAAQGGGEFKGDELHGSVLLDESRAWESPDRSTGPRDKPDRVRAVTA